MASKQPPKAKPTPKQEETPAKKPNVFTQSQRKVHLHTASAAEMKKPKAKSFSFFPEDLERLNALRGELEKQGQRHVPDSVVIRIALSFLADHFKSQEDSETFDEQVRGLLLEHR